MDNNYKFEVIQQTDVPRVVEFLVNVFAMYDPFLRNLNVKPETLYKKYEEDVQNMTNNQLMLLCLDNQNQVIGAYGCWRFDELSYLENIQEIESTIEIDLDQGISHLFSQLQKSEYSLLKARYILHKSQNKLHQSVFCDYFSVSPKYFKTSLSKTLASQFFNYLQSQGIEHIYGSFFNPAAKNLMVKNFQTEIFEPIELIIKGNSNFSQKVYLLYGNAENVQNRPKL